MAKKNKDNDIGTVLVFIQAPFLLRAEEEEVQGEKRRGAGLLSPSHVLLASHVGVFRGACISFLPTYELP